MQLQGRILVLFLSFTFNVLLTAETPAHAADDCEAAVLAIVAKFEQPENVSRSTYIDQLVLNDRPSFSELIDPDPKKNLFARAPLTAMGGAQRALAMVLSQGSERRRIGFLPEPVEVYPFLSDGTATTQGYRVEGNWQQMQELVSLLSAQAEGNRAGRSVPILTGPGGTGKSESRTVIEKGAEILGTTNPDYFVYSFDWVNLTQIKEIVKRWGPGVDTIPAPRNRSPITILPPVFQEQALEMAALKGQTMLNGIMPSLNLRPDSWSQAILRFILDQYSLEKGAPLTLTETVQAIAKHVRVRRFVMSSAYKQFPVINVQDIGADHAQLFVSSNPVVQAVSPEGKMDPFAYSYSGLLFHGDGNVTVFEEALRSHTTFLEKMMDGFESRELQYSGAAKEPWDSFVIAITNQESWDAMMSKAGTKALKQRFRKIDIVQPVQPQLVARTVLYGVKESLFMQPVDQEDAAWTPARIDDLFPIPERLAPGHVAGPERRYRVRLGEGPRAVELSPHTLRFMAQIIAATRFETDQVKAYEAVQTRLASSNLLTDPIQRLRYWEGMISDVEPEERATLDEITNKLGEGHRGIVHRNALQWLNTAAHVVRADPRYEMTLTPSVLLKVFEQNGFRSDGFIQITEASQESHYKALARSVLKDLLIPAVRKDIHFAFSQEQGNIGEIYHEVLEELYEDSRRPGAEKYTSRRTNRVTTINKERVSFIKNHYRSHTGREIPLDQIFFFQMNQLADGKAGVNEMSPEITAALSEFMAKKTAEAVNARGLGEAIRTGNGPKETLELASSLIQHMQRLGYNRASALDAFDLDHLSNQPTETAK